MSAAFGEAKRGTVYFIGAGPGAPDLMTQRGHAIIGAADLIVFADSLVDSTQAAHAHAAARVVPSSGLTLEQLLELMSAAALRGEVVARLQSGDPSLFGAMHEQLTALRAAGVRCEIVPGVSSVFAAAAALGVELTVPDVAQTLILTRAQGRASTVPAGESLRSLAAHGATLALLLSANLVEQAVTDLLDGGYAPDTPAAVAARVSWPDEQLLRCTLATLAETVRGAGIDRTALLLIGAALGDDRSLAEARSHLYDRHYSHRYRKGSPAE